MKITAGLIAAAALSGALLLGQEQKPVPKDSVRVSVPGCTKGFVFTAGPRTEEEPGSLDIPNGMHFRMNGPKKLMTEIKAHEGSLIVITGILKRGQRRDGIDIGGVRITPGLSSGGRVGPVPSPAADQPQIDVEGWRPGAGSCPSR